MCPSRVADGEERGWIVPIGGAEDRETRRRILKRFVQLCGGRDARHRHHPDREPQGRHRRNATRSCSSGSKPGARSRSISSSATTASARISCARLESADGRLLHRRQPAAPLHHPRRHAARPKLIRERNARGVPVGRHQRRRQHPQRAHDRVRQGRLVAARRQRAPGAGPRPDQPLHHRPALPPARPPRPPASRRWRTTRSRSASAWTRTPRRSSTPTTRSRSRAAARSPWSMPAELQFSSMADVSAEPAGLPARPDRAHPGRRRHLQPAHASGRRRVHWRHRRPESW